MISSISWLPKGAANPVPAVADPPSKEEIDEIVKSAAFDKRSIPFTVLLFHLLTVFYNNQLTTFKFQTVILLKLNTLNLLVFTN